MRRSFRTILYSVAAVTILGGLTLAVVAWPSVDEEKKPSQMKKAAPFDAITDAQTPRSVPVTRPEQKKNKHDQSDIFTEDSSPPSSPALDKQFEKGRMTGFDFSRDPLGAKKPKETPEEIMKADIEAKPKDHGPASEPAGKPI